MSVKAILLETFLDGATHSLCGIARVQDQEGLERMPNRYMQRGEYLDKMRKIAEQQRIHPTRTFYPGQTYQPEVQFNVLACTVLMTSGDISLGMSSIKSVEGWLL